MYSLHLNLIISRGKNYGNYWLTNIKVNLLILVSFKGPVSCSSLISAEYCFCCVWYFLLNSSTMISTSRTLHRMMMRIGTSTAGRIDVRGMPPAVSRYSRLPSSNMRLVPTNICRKLVQFLKWYGSETFLRWHELFLLYPTLVPKEIHTKSNSVK